MDRTSLLDDCPRCGAPTSPRGSDVPEGACAYCGADVRVPVAPPPPPPTWSTPPTIQAGQVVAGAELVELELTLARAAHAGQAEVVGRQASGCVGKVLLATLLLVVVGGLIAYQAVRTTTGKVAGAIKTATQSAAERAKTATDQASSGLGGAAGGGAGAAPDAPGPEPVVGPHARLAVSGAVAFDVTGPIGSDCEGLASGNQQLNIPVDPGTTWRVLVAPPPGSAAGPGTFPIGGSSRAFISLNRDEGGRLSTWSSLLKPVTTGTITRDATSFRVTFGNVPAVAAPAAGHLTGTLEMTCG